MCRKYEDKILIDKTTKGAYYINQRGKAKGNPQTARKTRRKQVPNGREDDPQAGSRVRNLQPREWGSRRGS